MRPPGQKVKDGKVLEESHPWSAGTWVGVLRVSLRGMYSCCLKPERYTENSGDIYKRFGEQQERCVRAPVRAFQVGSEQCVRSQ